jgi:hypothetical protein
MSAWIRSVTGRAYHFEPLNAKQLERPSPFIIEADLESAGCELVEETSQGFASSNEDAEWKMNGYVPRGILDRLYDRRLRIL